MAPETRSHFAFLITPTRRILENNFLREKKKLNLLTVT